MIKFLKCSVETAIRYPEVLKSTQDLMDANPDDLDLKKQVEEEFKEFTAKAIQNPHYNLLVNPRFVVAMGAGDCKGPSGEHSPSKSIIFCMTSGLNIEWIYNHDEDFQKDYDNILSDQADWVMYSDEVDGYHDEL